MINFRCDFCGYETHDGDNIQASNIIHQAVSRKGNKRKDAGALLNAGEFPDMCNACYARFLRWVEDDLRSWIRDNFPLKKDVTDTRSQAEPQGTATIH